MIYCADCRAYFENVKRRFYTDSHTNFQGRKSCCPHCSSENIKEAKICPRCHRPHLGEEKICDKCAEKLKKLLEDFLSNYTVEEQEIMLEI